VSGSAGTVSDPVTLRPIIESSDWPGPGGQPPAALAQTGAWRRQTGAAGRV